MSNPTDNPNPSGMHWELVLVSPQMAGAFLATMPTDHKQRSVRAYRVADYVKQRLSGKWALTHQGLAFDCQGQLRDGQHRCHMVVQSGLPTWFWICKNVTDDAILHTDEQLVRSGRDAISMAGQGSYTHSAIALATSIELWPREVLRAVSASREYVLEMLRKHQEVIAWTEERLACRLRITKGVRCLVARAAYHVDLVRLDEFCTVLASGKPVSEDWKEDEAAIVYHGILMREKLADHTMEADKYAKGQVALRAFLERRPLDRIRVRASDPVDLYPLPKPEDNTDEPDSGAAPGIVADSLEEGRGPQPVQEAPGDPARRARVG